MYNSGGCARFAVGRSKARACSDTCPFPGRPCVRYAGCMTRYLTLPANRARELAAQQSARSVIPARLLRSLATLFISPGKQTTALLPASQGGQGGQIEHPVYSYRQQQGGQIRTALDTLFAPPTFENVGPLEILDAWKHGKQAMATETPRSRISRGPNCLDVPLVRYGSRRPNERRIGILDPVRRGACYNLSTPDHMARF